VREPRTHCKNGHEYVEGNYYLRPRTKSGDTKIYRACRICRRFQEKMARVYGKERHRHPMTDEQAAEVLFELERGRTLDSICHGEPGKPAVIYAERVRAYRKANPDYEARVQVLLKIQDDDRRKKRYAHRETEAEGAVVDQGHRRGQGYPEKLDDRLHHHS